MRRRRRGDQRWILAAGIWRARGCDREDAFAEWPAVPGYWRDAGKFFGVGGGIQFRCGGTTLQRADGAGRSVVDRRRDNVVAGSDWEIEAGMDGGTSGGAVERGGAGDFRSDAACGVRRGGAREVFEIYLSRRRGGLGRKRTQSNSSHGSFCYAGIFCKS